MIVTKVIMYNFKIISLSKLEELERLSKMGALGEQYLEDQTKEALRLYKISAGDNFSTHIEGIIKKAGLEDTQAFLKEYTEKATSKFKARCKDCNSSNFEFRSSIEQPEEAKVITKEPKFTDFSSLFESLEHNK